MLSVTSTVQVVSLPVWKSYYFLCIPYCIVVLIWWFVLDIFLAFGDSYRLLVQCFVTPQSGFVEVSVLVLLYFQYWHFSHSLVTQLYHRIRLILTLLHLNHLKRAFYGKNLSDRGQRVWETSKPPYFIMSVTLFDTFSGCWFFVFFCVCVWNVMTFHISKCRLHM